MDSKDYVIASEIADYIYCPCCWWDRLEGLKEATPEMLKGTDAHNEIARKVTFYQKLLYVSLVLIVGSIVLLCVLFLAGHFLLRVL